MAPKKNILTTTKKTAPPAKTSSPPTSKKVVVARADEDEAAREARLEREKKLLGIKNPHIKQLYLKAGGERLAKNAYDPIRIDGNEGLTNFMVKAFAFRGTERKTLLSRDVMEAIKAEGGKTFGAEMEKICA